MIGHVFDENGIYIADTELQLDPLGSKKAGENVYFDRQNVTTIKPPKYEAGNTIPIFSDGKWILKNDVRGEYYSTVTQEKIIVDNLETAIPSNVTKKIPDSPFHDWDKTTETWKINAKKQNAEIERLRVENDRMADEALINKKIRETAITALQGQLKVVTT